MSNTELLLSDFDFDLPEERIAQFPLADRSASRLLHVRPDGLDDLHFYDIIDLLRPDDLLVMNNTKVIKARMLGKKKTGGAVEVLIERITGETTAIAMTRASKSPKAGSFLVFEKDGHVEEVEVTGREGEFFALRFARPVLDVLDFFGNVPLPPYITHAADKSDETRYQTVYAKNPGAVAAPTAGLHFTDDILQRVKAKGIDTAFVTLHVGAGTFQPVRVERLSEHVMHSEWYTIEEETVRKVNEAKAAGRRVVAVGTTSLRALESAAVEMGKIQAGSRDTRLFIKPGYTFNVIDALITNFHLPKSTLLMLVSALAGKDRIETAYQHAIEHEYRFFSYGDAMLLEKNPEMQK
ncbi:MAG: tRNA preQ1(34) S-adenosylmethionine ribosyltransferase-isomerase QueA [Burkholderiaceae bacterium]|nr:tRNA preQ1(34) S-adenosylmethionine ribosyltransferase-isomerase QueA [Burkholderiaceae bacterium]